MNMTLKDIEELVVQELVDGVNARNRAITNFIDEGRFQMGHGLPCISPFNPQFDDLIADGEKRWKQEQSETAIYRDIPTPMA